MPKIFQQARTNVKITLQGTWIQDYKYRGLFWLRAFALAVHAAWKVLPLGGLFLIIQLSAEWYFLKESSQAKVVPATNEFLLMCAPGKVAWYTGCKQGLCSQKDLSSNPSSAYHVTLGNKPDLVWASSSHTLLGPTACSFHVTFRYLEWLYLFVGPLSPAECKLHHKKDFCRLSATSPAPHT